jgi:hypothetical protein
MSDRKEAVLDFLKVFGLVLFAFIGGLAARPFLEGFWDGFDSARERHQASQAESARDEDKGDFQP